MSCRKPLLLSTKLILAIALCGALSCYAAKKREYDDLSFPAESGWKVGYRDEIPGQYSITEFIREGDDINNWKELLTIQNFFPSWGGPTPEDTLDSLKALREKNCPGVTKWNVIVKDQASILYEWQAKPCHGFPDQHEIAKIIYGKHNRFVLRYTVKAYQMAPEQRDKWVGYLSQASVVTRTRQKKAR